MVRLTAGVLALAALLVWLSGNAGAQGDKGSELKETMKKIGDGSSGLMIKLGRELRDEEPAWSDANSLESKRNGSPRDDAVCRVCRRDGAPVRSAGDAGARLRPIATFAACRTRMV